MKVNSGGNKPHKFDYNGEEVNLQIRIDFSPKEYKAMQEKARVTLATRNEDVEALAEVVCFLVKKWDIEDENGVIPLDPEAINSRMPLMVIAAVAKETQEFITNGGLGKKPEA
jgi:hypothetical protein